MSSAINKIRFVLPKETTTTNENDMTMYSKFAHRFIQLPAIFIPIYLIEYEKFVSPTDNKIRRTLKPPPKIFAAVQWPQTKISESVNKFHSQCFTVRYCVFVNKQFARKNIIYFVNTFLINLFICAQHTSKHERSIGHETEHIHFQCS